MSDYSSISIGYHSGAETDTSAGWAGTALAFGGTAGANELRFCLSTSSPAATTTTASANWPYSTRPASNSAVDQLWAFTADAVGLQVSTYDGANTNQNVLRLVFSSDGNFVSAPRITAFADNTHPSPSPGTQADNPTNGANIINGHATDTTSRSYLKGNVYGSGITAGGAADCPSNTHAAVGSGLTATSGGSGNVTTTAGAWQSAWNDLQGWTNYFTLCAIPKSSTAGYLNFVLALFVGPNMKPGVMPFCPFVFDYTFA